MSVFKENLILIGGGGHAKACIEVILSTNKFNLIGYLDFEESLEPKFNIPYLGGDENIGKYIQNSLFFIGVGQIKSAKIRIQLFQKLLVMNAQIATIISPFAIVSSFAKVGKGSIIMHNSILQANVVVGENCIINDRALLEHDTIIGNHCHISTATVLNGDVRVGNSTFIGSGAIVKNGVVIESNVIIGIGSVVLKNIPSNCTCFGNPALIK